MTATKETKPGWCPMSVDDSCCEDKCAWWVKTQGRTQEGQCAITSVAGELRDIAREIRLKKRTGQ